MGTKEGSEREYLAKVELRQNFVLVPVHEGDVALLATHEEESTVSRVLGSVRAELEVEIEDL